MTIGQRSSSISGILRGKPSKPILCIGQNTRLVPHISSITVRVSGMGSSSACSAAHTIALYVIRVPVLSPIGCLSLARTSLGHAIEVLIYC